MLYGIGSGYRLFVLATALRDLVVAEGSHPEVFADDVGLDVECVSGTCLEEAQKTFDNRGGRMMSFEVDQSFSSCRGCIDKCRLLRVVDQISCVYAYVLISEDRGLRSMSSYQ